MTAGRRIQALETEQENLQREATVGMEHTPRLTEIKDNLAKQRAELAELEKHWDEEKKVVAKILELRARLRAAGSAIEAKPNEMKPKLAANPENALTTEQRDGLLVELKKTQAELATFQANRPSCSQVLIRMQLQVWWLIGPEFPVGRMVQK